MRTTGKPRTGHLHLNRLTTTLNLAQRLPPEVAFRYHALPIAERAGCITVAMANPDDDDARNAVSVALGTGSYLVGGDAEAIDDLLTQIWPDRAPNPLHLLVCDSLPNCAESGETDNMAEEVWDYGLALSDLLNARLSHFHPPAQTKQALRALNDEVRLGGCDLALVPATEKTALRRVVRGPDELRIAERIATSVLVVCKARWPLARILLVASCHETDEAAADWVTRLARQAGAHVTIQAVAPPLPVLYQSGLEELLAPNTPSGRQLRRLARRLEQWQIEGTLCLRQGEPNRQIYEEVQEGNYDLVVVAAEQAGKVQRLLFGELAGPLLNWADRPVLIARQGRVAGVTVSGETT